MRKTMLLFIALAWVLGACAGAAQQTASPVELPVTGTEPVMTEALAVEAPTKMPTAEPTQAETETVETEAAETEAVATEASETEAAATEAMPAGASGVVAYAFVPEESTVTYEVDETFINQGNVLNTAVGRVAGVTGDIQVNFDNPQESTVGTLTVDISGFTSDSNRRDNALRTRYLQSSQYPMVTFVPTSIEGLPETIEPGVDYPLTIQGDITIRDVTRPGVFNVTARLQDDAVTGQATTTILMSDFGFGPIDILGMLKTEDEATITVDFVARPKA
jgi:polyisoprenoid-binding protein YceI